MWMSGRFTTAREPSERGCSGSDIDEMRSVVAVGQPGMWEARWQLTIDFLFVNVLDRVIIRVARRQGLLEWVVKVVIGRYQVIEQTRAAVLSPLGGRFPAAGGQVGRVEDGGIGVLLVEIHDVDRWSGLCD